MGKEKGDSLRFLLAAEIAHWQGERRDVLKLGSEKGTKRQI